MYSRSSYCVSTRILMRGFSFLIASVASSPPSPGIATSMRTTSGLRRRHCSTASRPSAASPTTSMSGESLRSARIPSLRIAWSSAMRTRILPTGRLAPRGNLERDPRALARRGLDVDVSAEQLDALADAEQAEPGPRPLGPRRLRRGEPLAVVLDLEGHDTLPQRALDEHRLRLGVPDDVGHGFLNHAEERDLHLGRQAAVQVGELAADGDAERLEVTLGVPADRRQEPEIVEHRSEEHTS